MESVPDSWPPACHDESALASPMVSANANEVSGTDTWLCHQQASLRMLLGLRRSSAVLIDGSPICWFKLGPAMPKADLCRRRAAQAFQR